VILSRLLESYPAEHSIEVSQADIDAYINAMQRFPQSWRHWTSLLSLLSVYPPVIPGKTVRRGSRLRLPLFGSGKSTVHSTGSTGVASFSSRVGRSRWMPTGRFSRSSRIRAPSG
jgi:hypothetical protein